MAFSVESLTKKLEEVKISDDCFFGDDLSYEEKFLNEIETKIKKEIKNSEISWYLSKRSMSVCFENSIMNEKIAKDLLSKINWLMDAHFFQKNGLRELGWYSKYLLNRGSVNHHKEQQILQKAEIVEFYWFNSSPNRFTTKQPLAEFELCKCLRCYFYMN